MTPDQLARVRQLAGPPRWHETTKGDLQAVLDRYDALERFVGLVREMRKTQKHASFCTVNQQLVDEQAVDAALAELTKEESQ